MSNREKTSPRVARKAAKVLSNASTTKSTKSLAGSALTQSHTKNVTTAKTATRASTVLRSDNSPRIARSLAGSVLTQRESTKKKTSTKKAARTAASTLTQHVSTRRTADGKPVRIVLAPFSGGSLRRDRVESVVSTVLAKHKKK